ncbi:MAG: FAD-containing monooxygenase EthA, partial [Alphaproteobacteria bacterium]
WTIRADMIADFVCRLIKHMDATGTRSCTPTLRPEDQGMAAETFITEENFNAGYLMRSVHLMPRQGDREPWLMSQNYALEKGSIPNADLEDGTLVFE